MCNIINKINSFSQFSFVVTSLYQQLFLILVAVYENNLQLQYISDFFWCQHCHTIIFWEFGNICFNGKTKSQFLRPSFANWNWMNWQKLKLNRNWNKDIRSFNKTYFNHGKAWKFDTDHSKNICEGHTIKNIYIF